MDLGSRRQARRFSHVIARQWRVWSERQRADEVAPYLQVTGVGEALRTPGNLGALLLRRDDGEHVLFELTTLWRSWESIHAFAGQDVSRAVLYPEDQALFARWDDHVQHFDVIPYDGLLNGPV